jgi:hypothetical protein
MIRIHESNTAWYGQPVAIITDGAWFERAEDERRAALAPYAWAEFKAPFGETPAAAQLCRARFALADVQMNFRIGLAAVRECHSLNTYECSAASDTPFVISPGDVRTFEHERFLQIPGVTHGMLNCRYVNWANDIIAKHPRSCLRLTHQGKTEGWFLSEVSGSTVHLVLAMLSAHATISGQHLYHRALREYAQQGATVGHAAFSVRNTAVLNIYSHLGAKFTRPTGCWLWISPRLESE